MCFLVTYVWLALTVFARVNGRNVKTVEFTILEEQRPPLNIGKIYNNSENTKATFSMIHEKDSDSYVHVDPNSSDVWLRQSIDREELCPNQEKCHIDFAVLVRKMDSLDVFQVRILVKDINDHSPHFSSKFVNLSLSEAAKVGTMISLPEAEDPDLGNNGIKYCNITGDVTSFKLVFSKEDKSYKLKTTTTLDREAVSSYQLFLTAYDGKGKSGRLIINILVLDVNDNEPQFDKSSYIIHIKEGPRPIGAIKTLQATDRDSGLNSFINYRFTHKTNAHVDEVFSLHSTTAELYVNKELDRETQDMYILSVVAKDSGPIPLSSSVKVIIYVTDINDNAPSIKFHPFSGDNVLSILEGKPEGTPFATVSINDDDEGNNGKTNCSLSSPVFSLRYLFGNKYELLTNRVLDRENVAQYNLTVHCTDAGSPPLRTIMSVPVKVGDVNDNPPAFSQEIYHVNLTENNKIGAFVYKLLVFDPDSEVLATFSLKTLEAGFFEIEETTGVISALISFDREMKSSYKLNVSVNDDGYPIPSLATVIINILDQNDNKPQFNQDIYTFRISENQPGGTRIGKVSARDIDSPPYNIFIYSLPPWNQYPFLIEEHTGVIMTTTVFDREKRESYHFRVIVKDPSKLHFSTEATINVLIDDQNDNVPIFLYPTPNNNTLKVSHNVSVGSVIGKLRATDTDTGVNGKLSYSCDFNEYFIVNSQTGAIIVQSYPRKDGILILQVTVSDGVESQYRHTIKAKVYVSWQLGQMYTQTKSNTDSKIWQSTGRSGRFKSLNFTIMIVVTTVALVIIIFLATLIVVFRRQQRMDHLRKPPIHRRPPDSDQSTPEQECRPFQHSYPYEVTTELDNYPAPYSVNINQNKDSKYITTKYFSPVYNYVDFADGMTMSSQGSDSAVQDLSTSMEEPCTSFTRVIPSKDRHRNDLRSSNREHKAGKPGTKRKRPQSEDASPELMCTAICEESEASSHSPKQISDC